MILDFREATRLGLIIRPLEADGTPANFLKAKPKVHNEICTRCKICAEVCPMGSISKERMLKK